MEPAVAKSAQPAAAKPVAKAGAAPAPAPTAAGTAPGRSPKGRRTAKEAAAASPKAPAAPAADHAHVEAPSKGASPTEKARLAAVQHRADANRAAEATHQLPSEATDQAHAAAKEPQSEADGRAREGHAQMLEDHAPPDVLVVLWVWRIKMAIRAKRPIDEDDLPKANPKEMAAAAGKEVSGDVKQSSELVPAAYTPVDHPPPGKVSKVPTDIPPDAAAPAAPVVNATQASPDPVKAEQVSLEADKKAVASKAKDAKLDREEVPLVKDGPVAGARDAQGEMNNLALWAPEVVLKTDKEQRASAMADFRKAEAEALKEMKAARAKQLAHVKDSKEGTKTGEEGKREAFGRKLAGIYGEAADKVHAKLKVLVPNALRMWDDGIQPLSERFDHELAKVDVYIKEHKRSFWHRLGDFFFGLPDWIVDAYENAEKIFSDGAADLALRVSSTVNGIIRECQKVIADALNAIQLEIDHLDPSLHAFALEEQQKIEKQFAALSKEVTAAKTDFTNQLVIRFTKAVQEKDEQIEKLREMSKGLFQKFADFVSEFIDDPVRAIINGLLRIVGIPPPSFWKLVDKFAKVVDQIADQPKVFANNLLAALNLGFQQFKDHIETHLIVGLLKWLTSKLKDAGVEAPKDLSLKSILTLFLQILGITWPKIRAKIVKYIGEKNMRLIELAWEFLKAFISEGWDGVWKLIQEKLDPQQIVDIVLNAVKSYIIETIVKKAAEYVVSLFNPAGIIYQVLKLIYNIVTWVIDNAAKIFTLIEAVVDAAADIMAGAIGGAANMIEAALGAIVPIVIDLFAKLLGLGGLPDKVKEVVGGLQETVSTAIDKVIEWVATKIGLKKDEDKQKGDVGEKIDFQAGPESHSLWIQVEGTNATVMIASDTTPLMQWLDRRVAPKVDELPDDDKKKEKATELIAEVRSLAQQTDQQADKVAAAQTASAGKPEGADKAASENEKVKVEENKLVKALQELIQLLGLAIERPTVDTFANLDKRNIPDHEKHHVPPKALANWIGGTINTMVKTIGDKLAAQAGVLDLAERAITEYRGGGNNLASISIHKFTHIKIEDPGAAEDYRVHHGKDTQRLVEKALRKRGIEPIRKNGKPLTDPEDIAQLREDLEAGPDYTVVNKASTQFFLSELTAAREEVEVQQLADVAAFLQSIQSVFYRAWVQALTAVQVGVMKSKRDGTPQERAEALRALPPLAQRTWGNEVDKENKVTRF
jgi:hypothetical protein